MSRPAIYVCVLLCALQSTEAGIKFTGAVVYDYQDLLPTAKGLTFISTSGPLYAYGTCDASAAEYMRNIVIQETESGKVLVTLAELVLTRTDRKMGIKAGVQIPKNLNCTIKNGNPVGTATIPFYVYVTRNDATIYDANFAIKVKSAGDTMIMTPFKQLTLTNFDTGKSESAIVSVAPPESDSGSIFTVQQESANLSVAKLFGPIATVKPKQAESDFSFVIDNKEGSTTFTPGAVIGYASPGYCNAGNSYAHPLAGKSIDIILKPDRSPLFTTFAAVWWQTDDASIEFEDGKAIPMRGFSGSLSSSSSPASYIKIHWANTGGLYAFFHTSNAGSSTMAVWAALLVLLYSFFGRN